MRERRYVEDVFVVGTLTHPKALVKYEIEATSGDELLLSLNEYHISAAINYAVFHNQVRHALCQLMSA